MKICEFVKPEIVYLISVCNFTEDENTFFELRCANTSIEECAERMNISVSTAKRLNKRVIHKIEKVI